MNRHSNGLETGGAIGGKIINKLRYSANNIKFIAGSVRVDP